MRANTERELKLAGGGGFRLSALAGEPIAERTFVSTYHDTPGLSLARSGITLRHRVEGRSRLWQLKLPQADARLEIEVPGKRGTVPAEIAELLAAHVRHGGLAPVASLRTERAGVLVRDHAGGLVEVVRDSVLVLDGDGSGREFEELELELLEGSPNALEHVEQLLRGAGAADGDARPRLLRVLGLRAVRDPDPADDRSRLASALREHERAILANDPGTRLGQDPEHLHRHRVAVRRLRAILRAARPMLDARASEPLRAELRTLGGALGPVRDLDVLIGHLRASAATLGEPDAAGAEPILAQLAHERERARASLLEELSSPGYMDLLDRLAAFAADPPVVDTTASLRELAREEFRKLRRSERRLGSDPADAELHALRIRVKRLRYSVELADPGLRSWQRVISRTKRLQDVLGDHQDAHVAEQRLRELTGRHKAVHLAAGRLIERERERRVQARAAYPALMNELDLAARETL